MKGDVQERTRGSELRALMCLFPHWEEAEEGGGAGLNLVSPGLPSTSTSLFSECLLHVVYGTHQSLFIASIRILWLLAA